MPEPRYDYEVRRTVGLRINSENFRLFNVHLNLRTRMFLRFAPLKRGRRRGWESYPRPRSQVSNSECIHIGISVNSPIYTSLL